MDYEFVVLGAGLAGLSLALSLAKQKKKFLLLDPNFPSIDQRGIALNYTNYHFLESFNLGLSASNPIKAVHISKKNCFGRFLLKAQYLNIEALGYLVSAQHLMEKLQAKTPQVLYGAKFIDYTYDPNLGLWQIKFQAEGKSQAITSKFLIAADGSNSAFREKMQVPTKVINYAETAIVADLLLQHNHQNIAYERFSQEGVIALLPQGPRSMKFIWALSSNSRLLTQLEPELICQAQKYFGTRLGSWLDLSNLAYFPLQALSTNNNLSHAIILGNAAQTLHPIAAQGFNAALKDIQLIELLLQENSSFETLALDYQNANKRANRNIRYFCHSLVKFAKFHDNLGWQSLIFSLLASNYASNLFFSKLAL